MNVPAPVKIAQSAASARIAQHTTPIKGDFPTASGRRLGGKSIAQK
jgi:hypothetical protein